jgi:hypothetical protein
MDDKFTMDELKELECESGITYMLPKAHCAFCKHCTDLFYDYTNGPYMFICELGHVDYKTCKRHEEDAAV